MSLRSLFMQPTENIVLVGETLPQLPLAVVPPRCRPHHGPPGTTFWKSLISSTETQMENDLSKERERVPAPENTEPVSNEQPKPRKEMEDEDASAASRLADTQLVSCSL